MGTVRLNGTDATRELLLFSATTTPLSDAGAERVTVPVAVAPPFTCVGDTLKLCSCPAVCGLMVNVAVAEPTRPSVAVMVTVCAAVTENVSIVKVAVDWPAAMSTVPGVDAKEVGLDVSAMFTPAVGATVPSVTVPVTLVPPVTEVGVSVSCRGGATVTCWVRVVVPNAAERVTVCGLVTAVVGMVTFAVLPFAGTVTEAGGWTTVSLLVS